MILLPFIKQLREAQPMPIITNILLAFGGVISIFFASKMMLPKIFSIIINLRIPDLLTVTVFVFLFGVAIIAHKLGVSLAMGADLVLSQDMETSPIFIYHILKFYNMPDHVSRIQTNLLRKEHYRFFFKDESQDAWKIAILDFIEQDNELFFIGPYSKHVSKKLSELEPLIMRILKL